MSTRVEFPKTFGPAKHISDGECLDCHKPASVYAVPGQEKDTAETVVVHSEAACGGFVKRFTPTEEKPKVTLAIDERGNVYSKPAEDPSANKGRRLADGKNGGGK